MQVVRALILTSLFISAFAIEPSKPSELHEIDLSELEEPSIIPSGTYYIEQTLIDLEDLLDENEAFDSLSESEKAEFLAALAKFDEALSKVLVSLSTSNN